MILWHFREDRKKIFRLRHDCSQLISRKCGQVDVRDSKVEQARTKCDFFRVFSLFWGYDVNAGRPISYARKKTTEWVSRENRHSPKPFRPIKYCELNKSEGVREAFEPVSLEFRTGAPKENPGT